MLRFAFSLCCLLTANGTAASVLPASLTPGMAGPEPRSLIAKPLAKYSFNLSAEFLAPEKADDFCQMLRGLAQGSAATAPQDALARVLGQDLCS